MPWPATHILIVEKVYAQYFSCLDRKEFILGTSFPDIRYPASIERDQTHFKEIPLSKIVTLPSFKAGMYFHSFVDKVWNTFIRRHKKRLFSELPHDRAMLHTMKILQDHYLYDRSENWTTIAAYFETILPEESRLGASREMVQRWHRVLEHYLRKPPNIGDLDMLKLSLSAELVNKIAGYYQIYRENAILKHFMTIFHDEAASLIEDAK